MLHQYPWLEKVIRWILLDGGAGVAAYLIMAHIPYLIKQPADRKRYWALGIAGVLALAAYLVGVAAGLMPAPAGIWGWVDALIGNVGPVLLVSQGIHGAVDLRAKAQAKAAA